MLYPTKIYLKFCVSYVVIRWWSVLTKCGPPEKGMAKHFSSCLENPMNSMKKQKDRTVED